MAFLIESELGDAHYSAEQTAKEWHAPYDEYERIAANLPSPDLPEYYPQVTDGTLPALMAETPMRIWGKLQTGRAVGLPTDDNDFEEWKTELTNILWSNRIVIHANSQAPFFTKLRVADHKSFIYGGQPAFSFPIDTPHYTGSDFILPYVKDVKLEPGKASDRDSDYIWMDRHYTKLQLRTVIEQAGKEKGHAGWDIKALKEIYNSNQFKPRTENLPSDYKASTDFAKTVTFSTCFHRGFEAPFYTIYKESSSSTVVRRQSNDNISGDIPINYLYNQQNLINPYGISQVDMAGPNQNLLDYFTAAHAYVTQQGLDPAVKIKGDPDELGIDLDSIVLAPGNQIFVGGGDIEFINPSTSIYGQFADAVSLYKTSVMNQQGTTDASVSGSSSGNSQYSKTPAGVSYQRERTNAKDNFLRQNTDIFLAALAKNLINIYVHTTEGSEIINITEEQREKLVAAGKDVPEGKLEIIAEFNELKTGEYHFDVDAGSSKLEDDDQTKDRVIETAKVLLELPGLQEKLAETEQELDVAELARSILEKSGVDNWEKIIRKMDPIKVKQMQMLQAQQNTAIANSQAVHEEHPVQMTALQDTQSVADDSELVAASLREQGWNDEQINTFLNRMTEVNGG